MKPADIPAVVRILKQEYKKFRTPYVTEVAAELKKDPYKVLISCIISLRTQDSTTRESSIRLFRKADTPEKAISLSEEEIAKLIYPAGFYRTKAKTIRELSRELIDNYSSKVPDEIDELLKLKGVGRKTANLVVTMGYAKPGICVDTHVHRITNRWGYVKTKTPEATEFALRKKLPERYWIIINDLLVAYGQNICKPISPLCTRCRLEPFCVKSGVKNHR